MPASDSRGDLTGGSFLLTGRTVSSERKEIDAIIR
jgi:hypothetical protein